MSNEAKAKIGNLSVKYVCNDFLCDVCIEFEEGEKCGKVHPNEINDISTALGISKELAEKISSVLMKSINKDQGEQFIGEFSRNKDIFHAFKGNNYYFVRQYYGEKEDGEVQLGEREIPIYDGELNVRILQDVFLKNNFYIIISRYSNYIGLELSDVLRDFIANDVGIMNEQLISPFVRLMFRKKDVEIGYAYQGFYPDGWRDGVLPYPYIKSECNPHAFEELIQWIDNTYNENKIHAYFNVAITLAKLYTPAIRMKRIFEDRILINTGTKRVGKTTLQRRLIFALGLIENEVRKLGDNVIKTQERLRNLLNINMAPLFLDEVMSKGFLTLSDTILSIATEVGEVGLHASKSGIGFSAVFKSLRPLIINTNLPPGKIIEILGKEEIDAYSRRILIVNWHKEPLQRMKYGDIQSGFFPCMIELWNNASYRNDFLNSGDIFELAMKILKAIFIEYNIDTTKIQESVISIFNEFSIEEEKYEIKIEDLVIQRAYQIASNLLKITNITKAKLIDIMILNPDVFGIMLWKGKASDVIQEEIDNVNKFFIALNVINSDGDVITKNEDMAKLYKDIEEKLNDGIIGIMIIAKSRQGILHEFPKDLWGKKATYVLRNKERIDVVPFRFSELFRIMFLNEVAEND